MDKYYTTKLAAKYLGVSPSRVRQLICEGRIKSEKYGRDHMIKELYLAEFRMNGRRKKGRPKK